MLSFVGSLRELRGDLLVHEEDEADDVGDEVENGGDAERIGGGVDICILHFRASSTFFHCNGEFIGESTSN